MISLPSKPWKKVKIETLAEASYRIVFQSDLASETAFFEAIDKDLRPCLGANDQLDSPDWATRSVLLNTTDLRTFKRNMVYACVMVELE